MILRRLGKDPDNLLAICKKNWGFDPVPLTYGEWTAGGARARDVDPTSAAYSDKIELWKKLPLPLANVVGPLIARGLA